MSEPGLLRPKVIGLGFKSHLHKPYEACVEECPLPHLTAEEAEAKMEEHEAKMEERLRTVFTPCKRCEGDTPDFVSFTGMDDHGIFCSYGCLYLYIETKLRRA